MAAVKILLFWFCLELYGAHSPKVVWASLVWFKGAIPKHSFIGWLIHLDTLPIKLRISKYMVDIDNESADVGDYVHKSVSHSY